MCDVKEIETSLLTVLIYSYNGALFIKKEENPNMGYNVDETWGHNAKQRNQIPKDKTSVILLI